MHKDKDWEEYQEKNRKEILRIEKNSINMAREKEVFKYLVTHPKNGSLNDLISINGIELLGKALLKLKTENLNDCSNCNNSELNDILECLYCINSSYEIILENGNGIKMNEIDKNSNYKEYDILFYDIIPNETELFSYLFDDESRYKIIRKIDNVELFNTTSKIRTNSINKELVKKI